MERRLRVAGHDLTNDILGKLPKPSWERRVRNPTCLGLRDANDDSSTAVVCQSEERFRQVRAMDLIVGVEPAL
jgi:hypothetical protein